MSTLVAPDPIRIACDIANPFATLTDLNTSAAPYFVAGDDIQFDIGIFENGSLLSPPLSQTGAGGIASVTLQLFLVQNDSTPAQMAQTTTTIDTTLSTTQWNAGTLAHASFVFGNQQTAISLNSNPPTVLAGQTSAGVWLRIFATTSDPTPKRITLKEGGMTVQNAPLNQGTVVTPSFGFRQSNVNGVIVPQFYDPQGQLWHTVQVLNQGGIFTLQVSDQGYP
jgi:hypothetical protein